MKAQDKIFIDEDLIAYHCLTDRHDGDLEYIRKDALLEWLKKEMKEWSSESNTAQGVKMGLTLVLDKIESL